MNIRRSWYRPKLSILSSMSSTVNAIFQGEKRLREWANGADKISKKLPEKGRHTLKEWNATTLTWILCRLWLFLYYWHISHNTPCLPPNILRKNCFLISLGYWEEKSLCHVAMVAKFLDDNKAIKSLKSLFALFQACRLIWQILAKFSLGPYLTLSKFTKRKRQFLCCVHLLHKASSWN